MPPELEKLLAEDPYMVPVEAEKEEGEEDKGKEPSHPRQRLKCPN